MTIEDHIVGAVLLELRGRGGFDHWWDNVDKETQAEIRAALARVVRLALDSRTSVSR